MTTQANLFEALRRATGAEDKRDRALALLSKTGSRQYLDETLRILNTRAVRATLDDSHRPVLREKAFRFYAKPKRDKAGMLRESLTRLLVHIEHHDDIDLYRLGVETYQLQPVDDVAQNLRAVALAGMAPIDPALACLYATRFLGEGHTSVFNCEPALTALDVLVASNQRLPIYQFLLHNGGRMANTGRGELTGKALDSLGADFPVHLYEQLIDLYQDIDQPTASMGIINCIIDGRQSALFERLEGVIRDTRNADLRRYGLVMMAAARDDALSARLLRMARLARREDIALFVEALEICQHPEREQTLTQLKRRLP